jgi:dTDP-4-amino-4,6-dideoxygalactose transaminase
MQDFAAEWAPPAGSMPVTEAASQYVIALPMHPYLGEEDQDRVIEAIRAFNG